MLKIKKIKLSGFRGILNLQELDLVSGKQPNSLVLFGLNSSGKTSFVDGLEWFLSKDNKIEWLRRDEAEEKAYPHQASKDKNIESFVDVEFDDTNDKIKSLTKTYDHNKITKPILSNEEAFQNLYFTFVIRPYFRYLEVVDFVCSKGKDKYEKLAQWMGFDNEFIFQEKIARVVHQKLKDYEGALVNKIENFEQQLKQLINGKTALNIEVINFCNPILAQYKQPLCKNIDEIWEKIPEINKLKSASSVGVVIDKLSKIEISLVGFVLNENLSDGLIKLEQKINNFKKDQGLVSQIDAISLYTQALDVLTKQAGENTKCPVCGKDWKRMEIMNHVKSELELLKKVKEERDEISKSSIILKGTIDKELNSIKRLINIYDETKDTVGEINYDSAKNYLELINNISSSLVILSFDKSNSISLNQEIIKSVCEERDNILEITKSYKAKIQPSALEIKLAEDIEKLVQIKSSWKSLEEARAEQKFTLNQINEFYRLKDDLIKLIQDNIKNRFDKISDCIGKYFAILRSDKDIKNIKIVLNEERGRAAGRSAEIELNYYDISVRPAYKVLSESLLNSLGLAVYFTCVKQFNKDCGFIVLDDIMNSLDIDKRDTLLDLIEQEFSDYQIILFTHDLYWFQKIIRRFPNWIHKKIKGWDYLGGAKIDAILSTKEEIFECASDCTRIEEAGWKLGRHAESILNELCENLWAEIRYRYSKNEPPAMEELFTALYKRLRGELKNNPIVERILEVKKYEPILRNFVNHARNNQPASVSPEEIKRASEEWFSLESEFWCDQCNQFVEYHQSTESIECHCGNKKLEKIVKQ